MDKSPGFSSSTSFLLSQIGAEMALRFAERLENFGINSREFAAMAQVELEGSRTQQQLADALGIHRNNMTALVDSLMDKGLAERTPHPTDRRSVFVILTSEGRRTMKATSVVAPELDAQVAATLSAPEQAQLNSTLNTIADGLGLAPGIHPHLVAAYVGRRRAGKS